MGNGKEPVMVNLSHSSPSRIDTSAAGRFEGIGIAQTGVTVLSGVANGLRSDEWKSWCKRSIAASKLRRSKVDFEISWGGKAAKRRGVDRVEVTAVENS
jgi:hypothetical protein